MRFFADVNSTEVSETVPDPGQQTPDVLITRAETNSEPHYVTTSPALQDDLMYSERDETRKS